MGAGNGGNMVVMAPPSDAGGAVVSLSNNSAALSQVAPVLRNSSTDLPDPQSVDNQRQIYMQQLDDQLADGVRILRERNHSQKKILKQQAEHFKRQYTGKIDHEVRVEEVNLDRQANHELLQLQHVAAHYKAMLEQQASAAMYEHDRQKSLEELNVVQDEFAKQMALPTLVSPSEPAKSLSAAYKELVSLPHGSVPTMAPPAVHDVSKAVETMETVPATQLVASPTAWQHHRRCPRPRPLCPGRWVHMFRQRVQAPPMSLRQSSPPPPWGT